MLHGDPYDVPGDDDQHEHDEPPLSRWSERMPTSVAGLAAGAVVCLVVIGLCAAALAWALKLLVHS